MVVFQSVQRDDQDKYLKWNIMAVEKKKNAKSREYGGRIDQFPYKKKKNVIEDMANLP